MDILRNRHPRNEKLSKECVVTARRHKAVLNFQSVEVDLELDQKQVDVRDERCKYFVSQKRSSAFSGCSDAEF